MLLQDENRYSTGEEYHGEREVARSVVEVTLGRSK